jgi:hypothetical protein
MLQTGGFVPDCHLSVVTLGGDGDQAILAIIPEQQHNSSRFATGQNRHCDVGIKQL